MRHEHGYAQAKYVDDHAGSFGSKLHKSISIDEVISSSEDSVVQNDTSRKPIARHVSNPQHTLGHDDNRDTTKQYDSSPEARPSVNPLHPKRPNLHELNRNSEDHLLHSPTATSSASAHLKYALLHLGGRDGGGSMSGANSLAPSDDEGDDHDHHRHVSSTPSNLATGNLSHMNQQHFEFPSSEQTQRPTPSQELEDDGDDEMSGNRTEKSKKTRLHHHHHHYHQPHLSSSTDQSEHRMANILGDGDELSNHSESQAQRPESSSTDSPSHLHIEELSLEEHQKHDQSIEGSVY
ncbi:hypothetical protein N7463_003493 [Penicillium fimorum]|uniref:Uncharacterized protein n=1 Tax=Penicillium fimorum TaxID=1882269 RepID=A0A9W9Y191_9EURO|nr:hypothetical protein N7463_003493 [Penicillium fimorum]